MAAYKLRFLHCFTGYCLLHLITAQLSPKTYIVPILHIDNDVQIEVGVTNPTNESIAASVTYTHDNITIHNANIAAIGNQDTHGEYFFVANEKTLNKSSVSLTSLVVTTSDVSTVHVITEIPESHSEGFRAISTDDIGNEYFVSTFCALGGYCQIAIATTQPGVTKVYVGLPATVTEVVFCLGYLTWRSDTNTSIALTYPQVMQIETTHDLTETHIYADQAVSVVVGTRSMQNDGGTNLHFSEQLSPVNHWGTEFFVMGEGTGYGSVVHVTAMSRRTVVEMSGFGAIKIPYRGYTIRRRLEDGVVSHVKANKPVQVMVYHGLAYNSVEPFVGMAMTLIPAAEHFVTSTVSNCLSSAMTRVYATLYDVTMEYNNAAISISNVAYTEYELKKEYNAPAVLTTSTGTTGDFRYFGGTMTCGSAIFPIMPLVKNNAPNICSTTSAIGYPGDGEDNNCGGIPDDATCYENLRFDSTFDPNTDNTVTMHTVGVDRFRTIKLRVLSCGVSHVELHDVDMARVLIRLSTSELALYTCDENGCVLSGNQTTFDVLSRNCTREVSFYWIHQSPGSLCVGVGPVSPGSCAGHDLVIPKPAPDILHLRLTGVFTDATFWYDILGEDCGNIRSDWQCVDRVSDCQEYEADLCTNPAYTTWVDNNCQKFCGVCSPDSFGKMFVLSTLVTSPHFINAMIVNADGIDGAVGVMSSTTIHSTSVSTRDVYGNLSLPYYIAEFLKEQAIHYIFSENENTAVFLSLISNADVTNPILPVDALGSEYMTLTVSTPTDDTLTCEAVAVDGLLNINIFTRNGTKMRHDNIRSVKFALNSGNQIGTVIKTRNNKPFALFCGTNSSSMIGYSLNQLPPVTSWGRFYVTPIVAANEVYAKLIIVTNSDNTVVEVNGDFDALYSLDFRGNAIEVIISSDVSYNITASFPVLVAMLHYGGSQSNSSFTILPATENFQEQPLLHSIAMTPTFPTTDDGAVIVVDRDGGLVEMTSLPGVSNDVTYFHKPVLTGEDLFSVMYTLFANSVKIVPSTSLFRDLSKNGMCELGTTMDDDCDGQIDEEPVCYTGYGTIQTDTDLDGGFGEDCLTNTTGLSPQGTLVTTPPVAPICSFLVHVNPALCWHPCACVCSWSQSLVQYNSMTQEEQALYNEQMVQPKVDDMELNEEALTSSTSLLVSAPDERPTSTNIGAMGIATFVLVIGIVVLFDLINLVQFLKGKPRRNSVGGRK